MPDARPPAWFEEVLAFFSELDSESDRAAVILGVARLDLILYQILARFLLPAAGSNDDLLDGDSPLSTFSSRINMARRLGLIESETARALHLIRKIRNSFAHELGATLASGVHYSRVRELVIPFRAYKQFDGWKTEHFPKSSGTGAEFRTALALIALRLDGLLERLQPLTESKDAADLIPPDWKGSAAK